MRRYGRAFFLFAAIVSGRGLAQAPLAPGGEEGAEPAELDPRNAGATGLEGAAPVPAASEPINELEERVKNFPKEGALFDEYRDVAKDLRCPTCTGLSVLESDAKFSEQIKAIVKEQVQAGKSKDDILKYFTERYGPWILRAPPREGFNVLAWAFPLALLLAGPPAVWFFVWRKRRVVSTMGVRSVDEIVQEMNAQLEHLRRSSGGRSRPERS